MVYVKILSRWLHRLYKLKVYYIDTHGQLFFPLIIIALFLLLPIVFFIRQALSWSSKVRITELWVYPVKGCGGKKVRAAMVTSRGFLHDRSFAILNTETGRVVTQRQEPRLALISCGLQGFDSLDMSYDGDDLILDEYMLAQTKDTRLFSVSDENDEDYQVSDSENDNDDDSKNLRVFLNHLNIPVMEARLKIYLRDLDADPLHGIREIRQLEMRSRVRRAEEKARAKALLEDKEGGVGEGTDLDSSNNNLTPKLPKSKYAALSDPLVSPSGRTDRAGFWRIATTPSSSSNRPVSPTPANSTTASPSHHGSPAGPSSPVPFEPTIHRVLVWDEEIECMDCGDIAALWLRAVFPEAQGSYRLVRMKDAHRRVTPLGYLGGEVEGDSKEEVQRKKKASFGLMTMSDARPFLLANKSSLDVLNKKLVRHTTAGATGSSNNNMIMSRFRPNIVVEGPAAFAEDNWSSVTFPVMQTLTFFAEPCRRCKVPTNDPDIGEFDEDQEPNTTLKTFHQGSHMGLVDPKAQKENFFGVYLDHGAKNPPARHTYLNVGDYVLPTVDPELVKARTKRQLERKSAGDRERGVGSLNKKKTIVNSINTEWSEEDTDSPTAAGAGAGTSSGVKPRNISAVSPIHSSRNGTDNNDTDNAADDDILVPLEDISMQESPALTSSFSRKTTRKKND